MKVLGVSGSPTKNSNTDVLVKAVLDATGAETEFVKSLHCMHEMRAHECMCG